MKNKNVFAVVAALSYSTIFYAQDPVVMSINSKPITKSEFEAVYKKNNGKEIKNNPKSV